MTPDAFRDWLLAEPDTLHVRLFPDAVVYTAVRRLLFHYTLILGEIGDVCSYDDRWCYPTEAAAVRAMEDWEPAAGGEPTGWHRHPKTGRRRIDGDPERESVAF